MELRGIFQEIMLEIVEWNEIAEWLGITSRKSELESLILNVPKRSHHAGGLRLRLHTFLVKNLRRISSRQIN